MNIAIVTSSFRPFIGGVEEYCHHLATVLSEAGFSVTILTTVPYEYKGTMNEQGRYEVFRFRNLSPLFPQISPSLQLYYVKNRKNFDVVINNSYHSLLSLQVGILPHRNLIFRSHFHGIIGHTSALSVLHKFYKPFGRSMIRNCRWVVCGSNYEAKMFAEAFQESRTKIKVIREGVEPIQCGDTTRERHRILTVARLERYKGVHHIICALAHLPDYTLDIVGDGPFKSELVRLADELHVSNRVTFHGFVERHMRDKIFCSASVFVLLSEQEAYGVAVGQALSIGLPCVVLDKNALSEWIDSKSCIGLSDPSDNVNVAKQIKSAESSTFRQSVPSWSDYLLQFCKLI